MATTLDPTLGYLWHAGESKGCFSPNTGKVSMTRAESDEHNRRMAEAEIASMKETGRGVLYLTTNADKRDIITNWTGSMTIGRLRLKESRHNIAGKRFDVWFNFDGSVWHGVNIGDNELLRCKRTKRPASPGL